jgi:hypothetical protein
MAELCLRNLSLSRVHSSSVWRLHLEHQIRREPTEYISWLRRFELLLGDEEPSPIFSTVPWNIYASMAMIGLLGSIGEHSVYFSTPYIH